ncbi:hypothetical protein [Saccharothrix longispora]|uniref:hypothetical protein n=1 Tax=Saccharothrix longispora TaxID=33920 RepID=UPI0028FD9512|nr:hypothetical protein [Saccharothrix longispora]MDU0295005.1 hypothetical protein [Saccharothrix longispora]
MMIFHSTATALVVLLTLTACSSADHSPPGQSGTPAGVDTSLPPQVSTPAPTPADEAGEHSTETYRAMWGAYATAATTADWQSPELSRHATGTALSTLTRGLFTKHQQGIVARGHPVVNPAVSSVEPFHAPAKVVISDCGDSTGWTEHHADTGLPAEGEPGGRRHIDAIVEKQADGSWKVTDFGVQEVGTC